jgi:hypothetical protein
VERNGGKHARPAGSPMPSADLSLGSRDHALGITLTSHSGTAAAVLTGPLYRQALMIEDRCEVYKYVLVRLQAVLRIHSKTCTNCATRRPNILQALLIWCPASPTSTAVLASHAHRQQPYEVFAC